MSVFDAINSFGAKSTIRESKDEMLLGELIRALSRRGFVADRFLADPAEQLVRFRAPAGDSITWLWIGLDQWAGTGRMTAKIAGARTSLRLTAELKLELTGAGGYVDVWRAAASEVRDLPASDQVKLEHGVGLVSARSSSQVTIDDYVLRGEEGTEALLGLLDERIDELRDALRPYRLEPAT